MKTAGLWIVLAGAILVCSSLATAARADGLPVLGVDVGATGVATPSGQARYVTIAAGADTVVARVDAQGGRIGASLLLPGTFTIPAVAYDGSASGLSGDGHTLILIEPRASFPRAETRLAVLRHPTAPVANDHHAARRLQLRRGLAGRVLALPHPIHVHTRPDEVQRPRLRPRLEPVGQGADRRSP